MKILALELSSASASVAVAQHDHVLETRRFNAPRGHGAEVFSMLEQMRETWRGIDRLAIGIGPGSYNGLRVACAVAGSFQMALRIELAAAPSCCLLDVLDDEYSVIGDARGGRLWCAHIRERRLVGEIDLLTPEECLARPNVAPTYRVGDIRGFEDLALAAPDAAVLARLASGLAAADPARLEPIYLKPPHITVPRTERP